MPVDMGRYPKNWKAISYRIRFVRANGRCECTGECGTEHVGGRCNAVHGQANPLTHSTVWLTVAHLGTGTGDKHDKMDVRDENLKAMCQHCHLLFDLNEHIANAKATRRQALITAGQLEMKL
jgi:hypothetical protein